MVTEDYNMQDSVPSPERINFVIEGGGARFRITQHDSLRDIPHNKVVQ